MASPLFVMFLSTRNEIIVHHMSLEWQDIDFENSMILSRLFSDYVLLCF